MSEKTHPQPQDAALIPRYAGLPTFMRLPMRATPAGVDIALVGVPFDGGTTNRAGARHGPREIRNASAFMRRIHHATGISPYDRAVVADLGDSPVNPIDVMESLGLITGFFDDLKGHGCIPITAGGDHLITLPILRSLAADGPVGMVHFDAHSDTNDRYFGDNLYTHGTPFRRAVEEGLLDPKRVVQIGIRGSIYDPSDLDFAKAVGFRVIFIEEFIKRTAEDVIAEAREIVGAGRTYVSFDVDAIDPAQAPGTGTPEIGGFSTFEAQRMVRGLAGLDIIGADVVEVAPPFDVADMTSLLGATLMFELLCVIAGNMKG
ncbi:agmatinase [Zavarzinia compransoris]|uniref:agmatinase n=1 Tax=Zavarzinia marina TaxID=2911065 RepID=UPI001F39919C|nr:agmatinase [Zavarzinia marina]MCF4166313.1 agmatinase [Zavarzinia marina]